MHRKRQTRGVGDLGIAWPLKRLEGAEVSLSGKDAEAPGFKAAEAAGDVF